MLSNLAETRHTESFVCSRNVIRNNFFVRENRFNKCNWEKHIQFEWSFHLFHNSPSHLSHAPAPFFLFLPFFLLYRIRRMKYTNIMRFVWRFTSFAIQTTQLHVAVSEQHLHSSYLYNGTPCRTNSRKNNIKKWNSNKIRVLHGVSFVLYPR